MNKIKEGIKTYRVLIIIGIVVLVLAIAYVAIKNEKNHGVYESGRDATEYNYEIIKYEANEYKPISASKNSIVLDYYKEFLYLIINDHEAAWKMISADNKKSKFHDSYSEFDKYLDSITTKFTEINTIKKSKYTKNGTKNIYTIIDSEENYIRFIEKGIWNITVEVMGKVELHNEVE